MAKNTKETTEKTERKSAGEAKLDKESQAIITSLREKSNAQAIVIAILTTIIGCIIVVLGVLVATGVIQFSNNDTSEATISTSGKAEPSSDDTKNGKHRGDGGSTAGTTKGGVTCYDDTRVQAGKLEFCLPDDFQFGAASDGVYSYNLTDDEGWAEVKVYVEKTSKTPTQVITNLSSNLKVTNQNYTVNGTTWVRAEAGDYMLALSTKHGDSIYTIFYTIKLDSDDTREAWKMILTTPIFPN